MDRRVHGVAKIRTRLIDFHFIEAETFNNRKIKLATWDFFFYCSFKHTYPMSCVTF